MYTFSFIVGKISPKSVKCMRSATKNYSYKAPITPIKAPITVLTKSHDPPSTSAALPRGLYPTPCLGYRSDV